MAATVLRTIKQALPKGLRCSAETGTLIGECCSEFVRMISDEANQISMQQNKCTIGPDHILQAIEALGFGSWKEELEAVLSQYKEAEKNRPSLKTKAREWSGLTREERLARQEAVFGKIDEPCVPAGEPSSPSAKKAKTEGE